MPEKKKQHFVPRFYLKNFSYCSKGKNIGIYNIPNNIFIPTGNLKHQAYENNFYGEDTKVEEALGDIENAASTIISQIIKNKELPQLKGPDHLVLLSFVVFQSARTMYQAETINESIDKTIKAIYKNDPRFKEHMDEVTIGYEYPATFSLGITAKILPVTFDLQFKLLVNETEIPFITSDNPVVRYNQFLESRQFIGGISGYGAKGLQMFVPINPCIVIVFYDASIYKVGDRKQRVINMTDTQDINAINLLQIVNARENIYFNELCGERYIEDIYRRGRRFLRKDKSTLNEYFPVESSIKNESLIHLHNEDVRTGLSLSFIKLTKSARQYQLGNKAVHVRDQSLINELSNSEL